MSADTKESIIKGIDNETIADNLNNKASFKSIVESIAAKRGKERTLSQYVHNTSRRRRRTCNYFAFTDFLYPSIPRNVFSQDWDGELNSGFFQSLSLKSLMPWMITSSEEVRKIDPVIDILHQKYEWKHKLLHHKVGYNQGVSKRRRYKWLDENVLYCPKSFVEMAEHYKKDPDPFLSSAYNWYYSGAGNLLITCLNGTDYIIHSEFNCLYVSPFFKDTLSIDYTNTVTYLCPEELNILETVQSLNFIALRTKSKVIILKFMTDELKLEKSKEIAYDLPFTSIRFDKFHKNILYVTALDNNLMIINLDRMTKRSKKLRGKISTLVDNWSMVLAEERSNYAHITRKAITLYDKRTNEPYQRWKNIKNISDIITCNQISAVKYCDQKPLMYIGTDHHLFLMDMRCSKTKEDNMKPVQRWSHGMMSTPTYIDIGMYDPANNKEMVCLSSQWCEDICVLSNYSDKLTRTGEIPGLSLPYRPPSILQTLNEAHKKKLCYHIYKELHERLCSSITGLAYVKRDDCQSIIMQNSFGDISCHNLYPEHMHAFIEDDSIEKLHEWCNNFKKKDNVFEVSHIIDIQMLLKKLYAVPDDFLLGRNTVIRPRIKFNEKEIYETFENQTLDPEFLVLWKEQDDEITLDVTGANQFLVNSQE